jgi:hypothetical protein
MTDELQTWSLVRKGSPQRHNSNKHLVMTTKRGSTPRHTDLLAISRNVTLTLTLTLTRIPRGGGLEYLHRSPASRKRRQTGKAVPEDVTGPPCSWRYKHGNLVLQVGGVSDETATSFKHQSSVVAVTFRSFPGETLTCMTLEEQILLWGLKGITAHVRALYGLHEFCIDKTSYDGI